jgi:alkanesulfonate monooxygenase SsuD/methylene tetrahydromethanopterin reductase-like flavin-dependent oxidoreductase (luciferase family)
VGRLAEAVQIIKAFFTGQSVTFHGQHYQVQGLDAVPVPVQRPRPPIMLGAAGRRMLTLAAREADILNFPDRPAVGVSTAGNVGLGLTFVEQMAIVRQAAGDRLSELELSSLCIPRLTDKVDETLDGLATQMQTTRQIVSDMPGTLVGSIDSIVDKLQANRERFNLSYIVVPGAAIDEVAPIVARLAGT